MKTEKIYEVEFMIYNTSYSHDAVSSNPGEVKKDTKYLDTSASPFLVRESDLHIFQKYGGGFRNLRYVGTLHIPDEKDIVPDTESLTVINDCTTSNCIDNCAELDKNALHIGGTITFDGTELPVTYKLIADTEFQGE